MRDKKTERLGRRDNKEDPNEEEQELRVIFNMPKAASGFPCFCYTLHILVVGIVIGYFAIYVIGMI